MNFAGVPPAKWHWTQQPVAERMGKETLRAACGRLAPAKRVLASVFGNRPFGYRCKRCQRLYVEKQMALRHFMTTGRMP